MASIFRKEPAAPPARERPKARPAAEPQATGATGAIGRFRRYIDDIAAELRKVTWPTREETRNLTIVVIGISAAIGLFLGGVDLLLSGLYQLLADTF